MVFGSIEIPVVTRRPRYSNESAVTRSQAAAIINAFNADEKLTYGQLSKMFGVPRFTVGRVIRGEVINYAPEPEELAVAD